MTIARVVRASRMASAAARPSHVIADQANRRASAATRLKEK